MSEDGYNLAIAQNNSHDTQEEAARLSLELPRIVPPEDRALPCYDAAWSLAQVIVSVDRDE